MADKGYLKSQALLQRIAELVTHYEDKVAELRTEYTIVVEQYDEERNNLQSKVAELTTRLEELEAVQTPVSADPEDE